MDKEKLGNAYVNGDIGEKEYNRRKAELPPEGRAACQCGEILPHYAHCFHCGSVRGHVIEGDVGEELGDCATCGAPYRPAICKCGKALAAKKGAPGFCSAGPSVPLFDPEV